MVVSVAWLEQGKADGATHVAIVCDTRKWTDRPVFVRPNENAREIVAQYNGGDMTRVTEVYDLSMDIGAQLQEDRAWHL